MELEIQPEKPQIIHEIFDAHRKSNTHCIIPDEKTKTFISSGSLGNIIVWNTKYKRPLKCLYGHTNSTPIRALKLYQPFRLISANRDSLLINWNTKTGKKIRILREHKLAIQSIALLKNKSLLVSGAEDNNIIVRDTKMFNILLVFSLFQKRQGNFYINIGDFLIISGSDFNLHQVKLKEIQESQKLEIVSSESQVIPAHNFHISCLQPQEGTNNFFTASFDYKLIIQKWNLNSQNKIDLVYTIEMMDKGNCFNIIPLAHQKSIIYSCENSGWHRYNEVDSQSEKIQLGFQTFGFFCSCFIKQKQQFAFITGERNIHVLGLPQNEDGDDDSEENEEEKEQGIQSDQNKKKISIKKPKIVNILDYYV